MYLGYKYMYMKKCPRASDKLSQAPDKFHPRPRTNYQRNFQVRLGRNSTYIWMSEYSGQPNYTMGDHKSSVEI